ncbi:MAG: PDDEXK nuclease domain-containing protein [Prevotella koreensis]|uniref:PDDEXK nuclease domain-containing protein n=1 Tax=Prevotella koreensis TaxID=2490854 RepID=UPI003F9FAFC6
MTDIIQIQESEYDVILRQAVAVIDRTRTMVTKTICSAIGTAHWEIGKLLYDKKIESKHGSGVVNRLSYDLKKRYPHMGVSPRNLWDMKKFYERFCDSELKLRQAVAVLPWGHTLTLMRKFGDDDNTILYYAREIMSKGWNRELLSSAISLQMHKSKDALSDNNFEKTLPSTQAMFANEIFRSGYNLGFLGIKKNILETELEARLVEKVKQFLLELGNGFTYIGNQHVLEYNGKRSKVDMLFFHRGLHCLVAIDLKIGEFRPEYAGKMNYYLSLLDRIERRKDENRSIGIILCAEKDRVEVELALEDMGKPIGVADYQLIVPKDELKKIVAEEVETFGKELHIQTEMEKEQLKQKK